MILQLEDFSLKHADGIMTPSEPVVFMDVNIVPEHDREGLASTISSLQAELMELKSKKRFLDAKRRKALDRILDVKGSIRVFCRVRPGDDKKRTSPFVIDQEKISVRSAGGKKEFNADRVFSEESTQDDVFAEVEPIVRYALDGNNVCIFAYGQTGTGKTYTMEGTGEHPGIVSRAIEELFNHISQDKSDSFTLSMSMLEVYMGSVRDLLVQRQPPSRGIYSTTRSNLNILSGSNGFVEVEGLTEVTITNFKHASRWYAKGRRARSTSWTNVNETSSRSHCLTRITICRSGGGKAECDQLVSKIWLVDLGGSERLLKTGATGLTLDEGRAINLSLSALGDVIASLKTKRNHIPYRNSKLTQILSDSLGDGSKVVMIVHISPDEEDIGETICSLSFARRVRAVEANKELPEELKKRKEQVICELDQQIRAAEVELKLVRNQMEKTENLIQEKMKILRVAYKLPDGEKASPRSPLTISQIEIAEIPQDALKVNSGNDGTQLNSTPHFMASTACSRQRHYTEEAIGRSRVANRRSLDPLTTQSLCHSLHGSVPSNTSRQKTTPESNISKLKDSAFRSIPVNASQNSFDSKASSPFSQKKKTTSFTPNLRVTLHRRRMSDLL